MPTLKEIKGRIASVKSTLKITSAMKLVSSAKLRKAQNAIVQMRPYEAALQGILEHLGTVMPGPDRASHGIADQAGNDGSARRTLIAFSSNSSLCGGFNAGAIAKVRAIRQDGDRIISIGKKMADAMRRDGFPSPGDFTALADKPAYAPCSALLEQLLEDYEKGKVGEVLLVYHHFVSTARQEVVVEKLLPYEMEALAKEVAQNPGEEDYIVEPSEREIREVLVPKTLKLKLYAALLDNAASEHAARTVAMQTATDNAQDLLEELTLQYNKGRQQKITSEILDLAGGQVE